MLYELRSYDVHSPRSLAALTQRFADHTIPIWSRMGIEPVGFWSVFAGTPISRLTYLLAWEDLAQRQALWDAFTSDPEWKQALAESETRGNPVRGISSAILKPTPASRLPHADNQPARLSGGVFELHSYAFDAAAKLQQALAWFGEIGQPQMEKHGIYVMGQWTTYIGVSPRLTVMLVFESLAHRERAWASFLTDPAWPALESGLYPNDRYLISQTESWLMRGTEFSGWR
ncbi:MAG: NIPSNAP family protein [Armatimonadota bacterium]|nr:NIPSNAP family protein [Armatimonadota bacterium]